MRQTKLNCACRVSALALVLGALVACTSGPRFDASGVDAVLTPEQVKDRGGAAIGTRILWGGAIVESRNLETATQVEVLAYPLNDSQRPNLRATPTGRFLILKQGYLETQNYARDRQVTVIGRIAKTSVSEIGEYTYVYPVVEAENLYLWPADAAAGQSDPDVHFGIGIGIGVTR